jgi:hypothetical protein
MKQIKIMKRRMSEMRSLLLLLLTIFVVNFTLSAQVAMKEYTESFNVAKGITLSSDTKYSDVELLSWDKDVVDIVAEVAVDASSKSRAEEKLEKIHINIGKSGNTIHLETEFDDGWSRITKVEIQLPRI